MNFDFSPDQKALRDQARKFLAEHASSTRVRRILDTEAPYDAELWKGMARDGLDGHGHPRDLRAAPASATSSSACSPRSSGRSLAPTPFASTIYLAAEALLLAGSDAQKQQWLPRIAQGEAIGCFALAEGPRAADAGQPVGPRREAARSRGTKAPVLDGDVADFAVVAARDDRRRHVALPGRTWRGRASRRAPLKTVDPTRSRARSSVRRRAAPSRWGRPAPALR